MKEGTSYPKVVQWSEEDRCYVGQCPGIIGPCCHGDDEPTVYFELCRIVDEWIDVMRRDGKPLPPSTIGEHFSMYRKDEDPGKVGAQIEPHPVAVPA